MHNILRNIYYYQFITCLTILKITALLMIFWNVFIHSHTEWSVKCRKVRCLDRRNFWNRTIITIIQKIKYFSIHIWLKLPYSGLYNAHWCIMRTPSWPWKFPGENYFVSIMRMDFKKIAVGNVRIKYQSYIFFSPLSMFHLLGEFKNHLSLFIFNEVAQY